MFRNLSLHSRSRSERIATRILRAVTKKTVTITQDLITRGTPGVPGECPIALAIKAMFPDAAWISVSSSGISLDLPGRRSESWDIPEDVARWIRNYDATGSGFHDYYNGPEFDSKRVPVFPVEPITFEIALRSRWYSHPR